MFKHFHIRAFSHTIHHVFKDAFFTREKKWRCIACFSFSTSGKFWATLNLIFEMLLFIACLWAPFCILYVTQCLKAILKCYLSLLWKLDIKLAYWNGLKWLLHLKYNGATACFLTMTCFCRQWFDLLLCTNINDLLLYKNIHLSSHS